MSEDLCHELEAIASIYGNPIFQKLPINGPHVYALSLEQHNVTLRLSFPPNYPATAPPELQGTESVGGSVPKGHGTRILTTARHVLAAIFVPGQVCLFDLIQALEEAVISPAENEDEYEENGERSSPAVPEISSSTSLVHTITPTSKNNSLPSSTNSSHLVLPHPAPTWTISTPITEKKSTFLARACAIISPAHAQSCIAHLLANDRRAAKATHNITAYRVRSSANAGEISELTFQDCDDDGESAAGGRMLHLLQMMEVWGLLVVVSRWFGGAKLGPDRFRIINQVVRDAVVKGGWRKGGGGGG
jgi:hypothetical protein